jgi:hypothetical protein
MGPGLVGNVTTYHLPRRYGLATRIDAAAARKRLLTARFQGWARGSQRYPQGLIGPPAETALSAALTRLAPTGYTPAENYGETNHLLEAIVQGGALDNAAFLTLTGPRGRPLAYTVPFEVKNLREWIYGRASELHQLLYKAAHLQANNPGVPIVPSLSAAAGTRRHANLEWPSGSTRSNTEPNSSPQHQTSLKTTLKK